jgi:hypothetical protein
MEVMGQDGYAKMDMHKMRETRYGHVLLKEKNRTNEDKN